MVIKLKYICHRSGKNIILYLQLQFKFKMRMENALENRDTIGVADAVLLDDPDNTEEFIENLRKRFRGDIIYVRKIFFAYLFFVMISFLKCIF